MSSFLGWQFYRSTLYVFIYILRQSEKAGEREKERMREIRLKEEKPQNKIPFDMILKTRNKIYTKIFEIYVKLKELISIHVKNKQNVSLHI